VDPTGAGDAFAAALAVSLAQGLSLRDSARRASVAGALTATLLGTQAAFPTVVEVDELMALRPAQASVGNLKAGIKRG
jgi:ribokinase